MSLIFHQMVNLMQADRVQLNNGAFGDNAVTIMNEIGDKLNDANGKANYYDSTDLTKTGGEQAQWAYWSDDGTRIFVLSRDMDLTEEVGISIFSLRDVRPCHRVFLMFHCV